MHAVVGLNEDGKGDKAVQTVHTDTPLPQTYIHICEARYGHICQGRDPAVDGHGLGPRESGKPLDAGRGKRPTGMLGPELHMKYLEKARLVMHYVLVP